VTVLAGVVGIIGIADMNGLAAIGLYSTLFGGIAWVVGAVWELTTTHAPAPATEGDAGADADPEPAR
jgi:hypothetical protein